MHENICLQCSRVPSGPSSRLVRDSCGHEKCRGCLLEDENDCKQCINSVYLQNPFINDTPKLKRSIKCDRNGEIHNELELNNHTGVIQLNGNVPSTSNLNGEVKHTPASFINTDKVVDRTPGECKSANNTLKAENKNIIGTKVKKPDKRKSVKRSYSSVLIPKHVKVILDPLSYQCTLCNKSFTTKTHVKYHVYCSGAAKPYKCDICGKEFILRAQLDVHSYKHKSFKPYSCQICKKSFSDRSKLTRHAAVHSTVKSHICSICGNAYRSKESLKIHAVIHKSEKPYSCKLCSAKFSHQSNLNKHALVHKKEKTHMCDLCGKRYKQKWALTVHKSSHIRGKIFECIVCLKKFSYRKDLTRHNLIHAETKPYKCSICSTRFRRQDNLRRHMKNTHPGKKGEVIKNPLPTGTSSTTTIVPSLTDTIASLKDQSDDKFVPKDNPNAINVITSASPALTASSRAVIEPMSLLSAAKSDCRVAGGGCDGIGSQASISVINGPLKLAFKTPAFKNHYNINRDFGNMPPVVQLQNTYNMAESVEICQKIMSTDTSLPSRNIIRKAAPSSSTGELQTVLEPITSRPLHYETSFQNNKHAMIKNIKFKVPVQYTSQFNNLNGNLEEEEQEEALTYTELRPASVIVNSNDLDLGETGNLHWRRRTAQNLSLKHLN